jgi:polyferredoxin
MTKRPSLKRKTNINRAWVLTRKTVQYVMLAVFISLFVISRRGGGWPGNLVNIPMRLDPLAGLANLLSSRTFLTGSGLALITITVTVIFGRAWCGWICPLGTTLDLFPMKHLRGKHRPPVETWRVVKYILLVATLTASLFGSLTLLVLDPLSLLYRTLTVSLWPLLDRVSMALERWLFRVQFLSEPVAVFDALVRPRILPISPAFFRDSLLFGALFVGILFLNVFAERFWCRSLCPLGGLLGLVSKIALFRRTVSEECTHCAQCPKTCPTGTINPDRHFSSDTSECIMCLDCLETCPSSKIKFVPRLPNIEWNEYDPDRRQALLTIGATTSAVLLTSIGLLAKREPPHLLRPPGAREANDNPAMMTKCIRCSACMRACPTNAIQPGMFETGLDGFGAPLLIMRMGYCDFSCNTCGQVCPVQAIPPLPIEEKQKQVIGKASINVSLCIAWSNHTPCIVCEEVCPLPQKAIQLEEQELWGPDNVHLTVKVPHVLKDLCIGCGICEYKCPVNGESAIQVFVPPTSLPF